MLHVLRQVLRVTWIFDPDKMIELVSGGSLINGATPSSFLATYVHFLQSQQFGLVWPTIKYPQLQPNNPILQYKSESR